MSDNDNNPAPDPHRGGETADVEWKDPGQGTTNIVEPEAPTWHDPGQPSTDSDPLLARFLDHLGDSKQ
jgi:hypothetical protein